MKSVFVITMWSGGRPAKKWKSEERPELLPTGTGVSFASIDTRLNVRVVGSISVEEFESGKEEFDQAVSDMMRENPLDKPDRDPPGAGGEGSRSGGNIRRLF